MSFSPTKSYYMAFGCLAPQDSLHLASHPLRSCLKVKDLGLRYSPSLNFSEQLEFILSKANQKTHLIRRNFLLPESQLEAFKLIIRPSLEYCGTFYGLLTAKGRGRLESVQRGITKKTVGSSVHLTYRERCLLLKLEPL